MRIYLLTMLLALCQLVIPQANDNPAESDNPHGGNNNPNEHHGHDKDHHHKPSWGNSPVLPSFPQTTEYPLPNLGNIVAHDPNILKFNDSYYLFKGGVHIPFFKAANISGPWEQVGTVLDGPSIIQKQNRTRPWAPTTIQRDGKFYCFYTVSRHGSRSSAIGVASTTNINEGNWTDHGSLIYTGTGHLSHLWPYTKSNAIDPAFIADQRTGKPYLTYGSFWHGIFQLPLADDLLSVENRDHPDAVNLAYVPDNRVKPIEGAFMAYREPYYYLWFSHGKCCRFYKGFPKKGHEYSIRVGRSRSVRGPFVDKDGKELMKNGGTTVYGSNHGIVYAPGGVGVISGNSTYRDVLYFHYCK